MNLSEYAKHVGRAHQQISRWIKPGGLLCEAHTVINGKNIIDVAKADELVRTSINRANSRPKENAIENQFSPEKEKIIEENFPSLGEEGEEKPKYTYQYAQIQDKLYAATLKKLKVKREKEITVLKADYDKEAFDTGRLFRDAMFNIPPRVTSIIASLCPGVDETKIDNILTTEITQALETFSSS